MYNANIYDVRAEGNVRVSENFRVREFACKDGTRMIAINPQLVAYLQKARTHFGKPMNITSAYRTVYHNSKVGGVANSQHLFGAAADVCVPGVSVRELYDYLCKIAGDSCGIGIYDTFVHFDVRPVKTRFDYRTNRR